MFHGCVGRVQEMVTSLNVIFMDEVDKIYLDNAPLIWIS